MSAATDTNVLPQSNLAPRKLKPFHYRFRITSEGFVLLIVMILVGFAAWHSGTNLLYLIFAILMAFYLIHGGMLWLNLRKLSVSEVLPETVVVGQPFDVAVVISNGKWITASHAVRVTHRASRKAKAMGAVYFGTIPRKGSAESFYTATVARRGIHELGEVAISTRYPFGFEERVQAKSTMHSILALPHTYSVAGIGTSISAGFGDQESTVRGAGTDLYGLREYSPGEHSRHIHWRTSARIQKLMISEYSRDERRQVMLFLDNGIAEELQAGVAHAFENAVTLTASLARHFINEGFEVGLMTADQEISHGQGAVQLMLILRHLATLQLTNPHPYANLPEKLFQIDFAPVTSDRPVRRSQAIDSRRWSPPPSVGLESEKPL